jgi:predicted phage terminase large subunit-like protein
MQNYNEGQPLCLNTSEFTRLRLINPSLHREIQEQIDKKETERLKAIERATGLTLNLEEFFRQAWRIIEPQTPLVWSWFYEYLCETLEQISSGEFKRRNPEKKGVVVNVPPRTAKSSFGSVIWPVWTWLRFPHLRFLCASYSGNLSKAHNQKRRDLITSPWFQRNFSDKFFITVDRQDVLVNNKTGYFVATSVGGSSTGFGGDICIGDDLLSRDERYSPTAKLATNSWLDGSFDKLLNTRTTSVFVHISQRLADDDPTGHLLGEDEPNATIAEQKRNQWVLIKIKREATERHEISFPQSGKVVERPTGDILQPERNPPHVIAELKMVPREWSSQEQQEPAPSGGVIFHGDWWQLYKRGTPLPNFDIVVVSVDASFKAKEANDPVAIHKIGIGPQRRMLLNRNTDRMSYTTTKAAIKAAIREEIVPWSLTPLPAATVLLIEDKANGSAILDELRRDPEINCTIIALPGNEGKTAKALAASADVEAGICYLPEDAEWYATFLQMFKHWAGEGSIPFDDDIDAYCQALNWARNRFGKVTEGSIFGDAWSDELLYETAQLPEGLRQPNAQVERWVVVFRRTATANVLLDVIDDGRSIWVDREFVHDARLTLKQKTDGEFADDLKEFLKAATNAQTVVPEDSGTFADELLHRGLWFTTADKEENNNGITLINGLMKKRILKVNKECVTLRQQIVLARWDADKRARGVEEPVAMNDEAVNALRSVVATKVRPWRLTA